MLIANIKEFRAELDRALTDAGFVLTKNGRYAPDCWSLPGDEVIPAFFPQAIREPVPRRKEGLVRAETRRRGDVVPRPMRAPVSLRLRISARK